ncbi:hypothetical protein WA158_008190 [Blastocystis sp. Blastoise]
MNVKTAKDIAKIISTTVNLPKTNFPLRANAALRDKQYIPRCTTELYKWQYENRLQKGVEVFTLHDGPPYANGDLHMGHFMNRVCKDFIIRYQLLNGKAIDYHLGWDCHGLPIEQKALLKYSDIERDKLDPMAIRKTARNFALKTVDKHVKEAERWGLFYDWSKDSVSPKYLTLDKQFEANEIDIFRTLMRGGYIYRGYKPIYWSPTSRTALADSEIEYNDHHKSTSIYVGMSLNSSPYKPLNNLIKQYKDIQAIIYTTTPWTIPSNIAISVNPKYTYTVVKDEQNHIYIIESTLLPTVASTLQKQFNPLLSITGEELYGTIYTHPLFNTKHPIITGNHVTQDTGTGLVHTSASHGEDDFNVCKQHHIINIRSDLTMNTINNSVSVSLNGETEKKLPFLFEVIDDVNDRGEYTAVYPEDYRGKNVLKEGNQYILSLLESSHRLLYKEIITHRYPYDWRAKTPVINRCTEQYFIRIDDSVKEKICEDVQNITMVPVAAKNRFISMIHSRPDWCISRQRRWGVPLPIIYKHKEGEKDQPIYDDDVLSDIQQLISQEGSDAWYKYDEQELFKKLPSLSRYMPLSSLHRGLDTLDVWFDSGSSWKQVLPKQHANVYFEGSDQHRGWFQSSAILSYLYKTQKNKENQGNFTNFSIAKENNHEYKQLLPFDTIITHGYINDEKGVKMSKSLGNTILPRELIETGIKIGNKKESYGTDICRLWASSCNYTCDFNVGPLQLSKVSEVYRRIRNTSRFILGNVSDFHENNIVPYKDMTFIDKQFLNRYIAFNNRVIDSYNNYKFYDVYSALSTFITRDLSSGYFDIIKDRLYTESVNSPIKLSTQTVLYHLMSQFPLLYAPIMPLLAEEIYEYSPLNNKKPSIFMNTIKPLPIEWKNQQVEDASNILSSIKQEVNKIGESLRDEKKIKTFLELEVLFNIEGDKKDNNSLNIVSNRDYEDLFLCSHAEKIDTKLSPSSSSSVLKQLQFTIPSTKLTCNLSILRSEEEKCQRCWKYNCSKEIATKQNNMNQPVFCSKCLEVLKEQNITF